MGQGNNLVSISKWMELGREVGLRDENEHRHRTCFGSYNLFPLGRSHIHRDPIENLGWKDFFKKKIRSFPAVEIYYTYMDKQFPFFKWNAVVGKHNKLIPSHLWCWIFLDRKTQIINLGREKKSSLMVEGKIKPTHPQNWNQTQTPAMSKPKGNNIWFQVQKLLLWNLQL